MSHRPPKKKKESAAAKHPVVDLRQQESEPMPSAEERLWLFWDKYGNTLMTLSLVLVGVVLAVQGYMMWEKYEVEQMQIAYQEISSEEDQITFAMTHEDEPLAGMVFLELADKAYNEKDYTAAAKYYEEATEALGDNPLGARAALGRAIVFINEGDLKDAKIILNALLQNKATLNVYRAGATYQLAALAAEEGDVGQATALIHQVESIPFNGIWAYKAEILKKNLPETH
tara:strand:+ start:10927 stop:11613 length:687 start_codon:yes stop_codon:yes gene_type:complete